LLVGLEGRLNFPGLLLGRRMIPGTHPSMYDNQILLFIAGTTSVEFWWQYFFTESRIMLMYCISPETAGSIQPDWLIWVLPYDLWSWVLMPILYIALTTILYAKQKRFSDLGNILLNLVFRYSNLLNLLYSMILYNNQRWAKYMYLLDIYNPLFKLPHKNDLHNW